MSDGMNRSVPHSGRHPFYCCLLLVAVFVALTTVSVFAQVAPDPSVETSPYIGAKNCANCHRPEFEDWKTSDHFKAMAVADVESVKGNFENFSVEFNGIESRFFKRDDLYFVTTTNKENKRQTFQIRYTFGHYPLQQYLIETENGRLQAFNVAWDSRASDQGGQRWFHLRDNDINGTDDPFFWQGYFQTWNSRCADCHSTNVRKNYDPGKNTFRTQWSDINVGCEACHGPGKSHYNLVISNQFSDSNTGFEASLPKSGNWVRRAGADFAEAVDLDVRQSQTSTLNTCGGCHSRRAALAPTRPGKNYHDQFQLQTLRDGLYYADGQIQDEVFVMGSFMQSKMYQKGVTCANCHNVHSAKLRLEGNALCLQCHKAETFDASVHHGHKLDSAAAQCTVCHMPATTYMNVDPRRDHSFSIPRPDLSIQFGVPNACVNCHQGKTDQWAQQALVKQKKLQGSIANDASGSKTGSATAWVKANYRSRNLDPLATREIESLLKQSRLSSIRHATLLNQLSSMPSRVSAELAGRGLANEDPLVRRAAVEAIQSMPPRVIVSLLSGKLDDTSLAVRGEMGRLFASIIDQVPPELRSRANQLISEYKKTLEYGIDSPANLSSLASLNLYLGNFDSIEALYLKALEIEPAYVPAMVNLADWYRSQGNEAEAGSMLARAVQVAPDSAMAQHALGLQLVRLRQYDKALSSLKLATEQEDAQPRYLFVYAIALESQGRLDESIRFLTKAVERWPNQYDLLLSLTNFMDRQGRLSETGQYISKLSKIAPTSPQVKDLIARFQQL